VRDVDAAQPLELCVRACSLQGQMKAHRQSVLQSSERAKVGSVLSTAIEGRPVAGPEAAGGPGTTSSGRPFKKLEAKCGPSALYTQNDKRNNPARLPDSALLLACGSHGGASASFAAEAHADSPAVATCPASAH
jgi:hypothetical protein